MYEKVHHICKVVSNKRLCPRFMDLRIEAIPILKHVVPGQFVHIRVSDNMTPFFRRPFSVARAGQYLEVIYEVLGKGTKLLSEKKQGDYLDILGPLGNGFSMPPKGVKQVVMVAGGVGIAPFLFLSEMLSGKGFDLIVLYGARNKDYIFDMKEFRRNGCRVFIATDDGSVGEKGRVSVLFQKIEISSSIFIYTCGPKPMMASVQDFARRYGLRGQASCEETMACGVGACMGCVTKTMDGYRRVCLEGPVFDLDKLVFKF